MCRYQVPVFHSPFKKETDLSLSGDLNTCYKMTAVVLSNILYIKILK